MFPPKKKKRFRYEKGIVIYDTISADIALAHERTCKMGVLSNSYTHGVGRMTGFLGEIAVNLYLRRSKYVGSAEHSFDLLYKKKRIEIKSKTCGGLPEPHYNAFVNSKKDVEHDNDVYFFTRVRRDLQKVYLVGWLPTDVLFKKATFFYRGDKDETGFQFKSSGYVIPIKDLLPPKELK